MDETTRVTVEEDRAWAKAGEPRMMMWSTLEIMRWYDRMLERSSGLLVDIGMPPPWCDAKEDRDDA